MSSDTPPAEAPDRQHVGLVLSGGGAKGAFEAGVILAMEEAGLHADVLAGTSAGALNAAALAVGLSAQQIVDLWTVLESRDVYRPRFDAHHIVNLRHLLSPRAWSRLAQGDLTLTDHALDSVGWSWLLSTDPLRERLVDLLGGETLAIEDERVLTIPAVDLTTGSLVRFTNRRPRPERDNEGTIVGQMTVDHLMASAAIPILFQPPRLDGRLYWDGGLVANTPLRAALQHEPDVCFVVATGAVEHEADEPESLGGAITLVIDHILRYALLEDLDHARTVNQLVAASPDASKHKLIEFVAISPEPKQEHGLGDLLDFEPDEARALIDEGHRIGARAIEHWRAGDADVDAQVET